MYFLIVRMLLTVLDDHRKENGVLSAEDKDKISGYTAIHIHRETQHTRQNVCISLLPLNVMEIKIFLTGIIGMSIKHHMKLCKST